jgi:hypothetical protein
MTGSARVPLGGFSQLVGSNGIQPVQVHRAHGDPDRIATSRASFFEDAPYRFSQLTIATGTLDRHLL